MKVMKTLVFCHSSGSVCLYFIMLFGLHNRAATFQRSMKNNLIQHKKYAEICINDLVISFNNWSDNFKHLGAY